MKSVVRAVKAGFLNYSLFLLFLILNAFKNSITYLYLGRHNLSRFAGLLLIDIVVFVFATRFKKSYVFIGAYIVQVLFFEINLDYFLIFDDYIHVNSIFLLREILEAAERFSMPVDLRMLIPFADLPLFIMVAGRYVPLGAALLSQKGLRAKLIAVAVALSAFNYIWIYEANKSFSPSRDFESIYEINIIEKYGLADHYFFDITKYFGERWKSTKVKYGPELSMPGHSIKKMNIITIQFESLDANIIDFKHNGAYIAPFLNRLSKNSIYYPYVLSYRRIGGTSDAEISVFNSLEPPVEFPLIESTHYDYPNSIMKIFAAASYGIYAFHGNAASFYNRNYAYKAMGFSKFYDISGMGLKEEGWGASDQNVFNYVSQKLRLQKEPFFYHIITMSSHEPFVNVKKYYKNRLYDDIDTVLTRDYFNSISYADGVLENFVSFVKKTFPDTCIFIYGDHTPYVINTGPYRRAVVSHNQKEFEFVPLLIVTPEGRVYREDKMAACYLDFGPSLLYSAGLPFTIRSEGVNLLDIPIPDRRIPYKGDYYRRGLLFELMRDE